MKVRIYYNLHRKQLSVQSKTAKGWRVVNHASRVTLENVRFKVSEAGRQRVLRERKKNVHAFIEGDLVLDGGGDPIAADTLVSYNPYLRGSFYERNSMEAIDKAKFAVIVGREILVNK
jgi:hypothetical protein